MRVAAVIVAGGRSSRMGREKLFKPLRGRMILDWIRARLEHQTGAIFINANGDPERFHATGLGVIADLRRAGMPLAGLHAALHLARERGFGCVLTVPSDTPFLPDDLVARLAEVQRPAAIASSGGQMHYLTGLWSPDLLHDVEQALDAPRLPRLMDFARHCGAAVVDWPVHPFDPFFNVNTPEDLAQAERIAAEFLS
jgi:molybdopterin-guanine dinucleotide biosynthesis protein A